MSDKKVKLFGLTIFKRRTKGNETTTRVFNIPVWKKVKQNGGKKYYLFGIKVLKSKLNTINNISQSGTNSSIKISFSNKELNIAFFLTGGIGDFVIAGAYIKKFCEKFNIRTDIVSTRNCQIIQDLFYNQNFIRNIYPSFKNIENNIKDYDLFIRLSRFPEIKHVKEDMIKKYSKTLFKYINLIQDFNNKNSDFFQLHPKTDGLAATYCLAQGIKRYNQPDIDGFFKIKENHLKYLKINNDNNCILEKYKLTPQNYITIHRGVDSAKEYSTKLWPYENYNKLILQLKKYFPNKHIVQLGISPDRCRRFKGIDLSLVGKTTFGELKVILKNSFLHIDAEGGMTHLRHALGGGASVVFFGPTSKDFYAYSENINIKSNMCPIWCEWVKTDWNLHCIKTGKDSLCMRSLLPSMVMQEIRKAFSH